jgi:hypothetical protein
MIDIDRSPFDGMKSFEVGSGLPARVPELGKNFSGVLRTGPEGIMPQVSAPSTTVDTEHPSNTRFSPAFQLRESQKKVLWICFTKAIFSG